MKEKKVSAIVVNWNGIKFLPDCLSSLFNQTYKNLEVIVVDCASQDESVSFIKTNYPRTKVIELKQDFGPPYAINLACREAQGEYILILNNDVYLPENLVAEMVAELEKDENCVINPAELNWEGEYQRAGCTDPWISSQLYKIFKPSGFMPSYPSTACCLVVKEVLQKIPLNENLFMYEDTEWGWHLHLKGVKLKVMLNNYFLHKCEGTIGNSPKSALINGRTPLATMCICFKFSTLCILLPLFMIYYYLHPKKLGYLLIKGRLVPFFKGFFSFFRRLPLFLQDRKRVQKGRIIGDLELFKIIVGSIDFQKKAKANWGILNSKLEPKNSVKELWVTVQT